MPCAREVAVPPLPCSKSTGLSIIMKPPASGARRLSSPQVEQAALADFMQDGHLAHSTNAHALHGEAVGDDDIDPLRTRRCRRVCRRGRRNAPCWMPANRACTTVRAADEAAKAGINTIPVSSFAPCPRTHGGLFLGYAGLSRHIIKKIMRELGAVIRTCFGAMICGQIHQETSCRSQLEWP
jgi:DNA-binding transcriptional MocR family regulator